MAKGTFFQPVDLEEGWGPGLPDGFERVEDGRLVVKSEGLRLDYRGAFDVRDGEVLGGTIETIRASFRGEPSYEITDLSYDLLDYAHLWATEGYLSALQMAFEGDATIRGSDGDDVLNGFIGDDVIRGGRGADSLQGEVGNDRLSGGGGKDYLDGWDGHDRLNGGRGDDVLVGWDGHDRIKGGGGDDILFGGRGDDKLKGGGGKDAFVFSRGEGRDVIRDFEKGADLLVIDDDLGLADIRIREKDAGTYVKIEGTKILLRNVADFDSSDIAFSSDLLDL